MYSFEYYEGMLAGMVTGFVITITSAGISWLVARANLREVSNLAEDISDQVKSITKED